MKFEDLIPFVSENFITVPLWEEGDYTPYINFWLDKVKFKERFKHIDFNSDSPQKVSQFSDTELYVDNVGDVMVDLQLCIPGEYDIQKLIDKAGEIINKTNTVWKEKGTEIEFKGGE